jgi:uncharacterized protein (DUF2141 family)
MIRHMTRLVEITAAIVVATVVATAQQRDAAAPRPAPATGVVGGLVLSDEATPRPVRRAVVTINSVDGRTASQTTVSGDDGRFVFDALPAGRYVLQSSKRAWLDASYGATRLGRPGTPVAIADGQHVTDLTIRMTKGGVIAGVIRDDQGVPMPAVNVAVMRWAMRNGQRVLVPTWTTRTTPVTDDTGAYRFYGLAPGDYVVGVIGDGRESGRLTDREARQILPNELADAEQLARQDARTATSTSADALAALNRGPLVNPAPVFYPGTSDLAAAATITLGPGDERTGVDLVYRLTPTSRIDGTVSVPEGVETSNRIELRMGLLIEEKLGDRLVLPSAVMRADKDGRFFANGLLPGRYSVLAVTSASYSGPGTQGAPTGSTTLRLTGWARTEIDVAGADLTLALTLQRPLVMAGRVVFEGTETPTDAGGVTVGLQPVAINQMMAMSPSTPIGADRTFEFNSLTPGQFALVVNAPRGSPWLLKSATAGGRDLLDAPIDVAGDMRDVVVTMTKTPSELTGTLSDPSGRPAPEYFILAFPAEKRHWTPTSFRIRQTRPATDGRFSILGLPAGDYLLAALTDVEPDEWLDPRFLEQVAPAGITVTIAEGQRTAQDIRIKGG